MAKYIVDLQEIYEDKTDIDEYLISTDSRAITNTFTRKSSVKNDTRVALTPSEKLDVSMEKIDRYLQQIKDVAFFNPLTSINATISSEANQVFTAKVVRSFYDDYTIQKNYLSRFASMYKYNLTSNTLVSAPGEAFLVTDSKGTSLNWLKLVEATVDTANKLTVYDANSNASTTLKAYTKDDITTPEYLYGSLSANLYNVKPFKSGNVKVGEATLSEKANVLRMYAYDGSLVSSGVVGASQIINNSSNYVELVNNLSKTLVINSAREACTINSGGTLGGDKITLTWKGELGTPAYVFGGPDKNDVHVYSPENFSVNYAKTAGSANTARYATSAGTADAANTANSASTADYAKTAGSATSADTANSAKTATTASSATTAESANKVWTQSHKDEWYINCNNSTSTEGYFVTDAKCNSDGSVMPIWVGKATTAVDAAHATAADSATKAGTADLADAVAWSNITGKPSTYSPATHTHSFKNLTDMPYFKVIDISKTIEFSPENADNVSRYDSTFNIDTKGVIKDSDRLAFIPNLMLYIDNPVTGQSSGTHGILNVSITITLPPTVSTSFGISHTWKYAAVAGKSVYIPIGYPIVNGQPYGPDSSIIGQAGRPTTLRVLIKTSQQDIYLGNSNVIITLTGSIIGTTLITNNY